MSDGWSEVSLSAHASDLSSEDIRGMLPGSEASQQDPHLASVEFKPRPGARLDDVLAEVAHYLNEHGAELRSDLGSAEFQLRIAWSPHSPEEQLPASSSLLAALAALNPEVVIDASDEADETAEPTKDS
jgi:hypothetical protein